MELKRKDFEVSFDCPDGTIDGPIKRFSVDNRNKKSKNKQMFTDYKLVEAEDNEEQLINKLLTCNVEDMLSQIKKRDKTNELDPEFFDSIDRIRHGSKEA